MNDPPIFSAFITIPIWYIGDYVRLRLATTQQLDPSAQIEIFSKKETTLYLKSDAQY